MKPLLQLEHVSFSYHEENGETPALTNLSFSLDPGQFLAIVGPSGCGKSTLLSLICGLLSPEEGSILLNNAAPVRGAANIGYMLQRDHLFEWRTIYSNVLLGLEIQKKLSPARKKAVDSMLETYGLSAFRDARPSQLSGGMRQRAALIRTLALEPDSASARRAFFRPRLPDAPFRLRRYLCHYQKRKENGDSRHPRSVRSHQHG